MSKKSGVTNKKEFDKKVKKLTPAVEKAIRKGLIKSTALVTRVGKIKTPVDTGNLINSWYASDPKNKGQVVSVEIGLTAMYAPMVHEMIGARFRKPGSQAKFLENALKETAQEVRRIIGNETKRGLR